MAAKAYSTINTVLKAGTSADSVKQLCKIKSYPDLGGAPETIETTDLEDTFATFVEGVQSLEQMTFTANYTPAEFKAIKELAGTEQYFELDMGADGAQGKFTWQGTVAVYKNGGEVNAVREMTIVVTPSSAIDFNYTAA